MMLKNKSYDPEELLEIMVDIVSDTKRAGAVIRNLRDLYKDQKVSLSVININSIVKEAKK